MMCGSCWAFSSTAMLSDRFCIHSEGQINVVLSPQDLVSCNYENLGCGGGLLIPTIDYLITEGVVSETCKPYEDQNSMCSYKCTNKSEPFVKYYCKPRSMIILSKAEDIKWELLNNGPLMVGMTVYEDFMSYKSGVYSHVEGGPVGGHAIKLIGWDHTEEGELYWILQN